MKKTLTLLVASTALTAAVAIPAWSAMQARTDGSLRPFAALFEEGAQATPLVLTSDDEDDDDRRWREVWRSRHDDDEDEEDDCEDDDDDCRGGGRNPGPASTIAPPQNGLFGNGAPPQVQVN